MPAKRDLCGQRFGGWLVLTREPRSKWLCRCDCGNEKACQAWHLTAGKSTSCGCKRGDANRRRSKHGLSRTRIRFVWTGMKQRCTNPNYPQWMDYGGRGVKVCRELRQSLPSFMSALGPQPTRSHSVDRVDNGGHYSCGRCDECKSEGWPCNVRWATRREQNSNRRSTHRVEWNGETRTVQDWSARLDLPYRLLLGRLEAGWPVAKVMTHPHRKRIGAKSAKSERDRLQTVWWAMVDRCHRPGQRQYHNYGGRGITVCARWRASSSAFVSDIGPRPTPVHSVDRIDNDKGYWCGKAECPECGPLGRVPNCRYATRVEQARNTRPRRRKAAASA